MDMAFVAQPFTLPLPSTRVRAATTTATTTKIAPSKPAFQAPPAFSSSSSAWLSSARHGAATRRRAAAAAAPVVVVVAPPRRLAPTAIAPSAADGGNTNSGGGCTGGGGDADRLLPAAPTRPKLAAGNGNHSPSSSSSSHAGKMSMSVPQRAAVLVDRLDPRVMLSLVPFLGALMPVIGKLLFMLPRALPVPAYNTLRLLLSCCTFLPMLVREVRLYRRNDATTATTTNNTFSTKQQRQQQRQQRQQQRGTESSSRPPLWRVLLPGMELGLLVFFANAFQLIGLKYTTAGRAAFIAQLSTVFTPLSAAAMGMQPLTAPVVAGAAACVSGIFALTTDAPAPTDAAAAAADAALSASASASASASSPAAAAAALAWSPSSMQWLGDSLQLLSAFMFTLYVLRIHCHTRDPKAPPGLTISFKVLVQTALSLSWMGATWLLSSPQRQHHAQTAAAAVAAAAVAVPWSPALVLANMSLVLVGGLMVNALGSWLQMRGQAKVPPGETAVLFATQPIWTAVFAAVVLGERFSGRGMVGAALVVAGTLIASVAPRREKQQKQT